MSVFCSTLFTIFTCVNAVTAISFPGTFPTKPPYTIIAENLSDFEIFQYPCSYFTGISNLTTSSILNVTGREEAIKNSSRDLDVHQNGKNTHIKIYIPYLRNCDYSFDGPDYLINVVSNLRNLSSSNNSFNLNQLKELYKTFLILAINYRHMAEDWENSKANGFCSRNDARYMAREFTHLSHDFRFAACELMDNTIIDYTDPAAYGAPYPNSAMLNNIIKPIYFIKMYKYPSCSTNRLIRDCAIFKFSGQIAAYYHEIATNMYNNINRK